VAGDLPCTVCLRQRDERAAAVMLPALAQSESIEVLVKAADCSLRVAVFAVPVWHDDVVGSRVSSEDCPCWLPRASARSHSWNSRLSAASATPSRRHLYSADSMPTTEGLHDHEDRADEHGSQHRPVRFPPWAL
jgi:hypothetical protein